MSGYFHKGARMLSDEMLTGFLDEVRIHITAVKSDLRKLEISATDTDSINRMLRSVRSIKGGAIFFGLENLISLTDGMENLITDARNSTIVLTKEYLQGLIKGFGKIIGMVENTQTISEADVSDELMLLESLLGEGRERDLATDSYAALSKPKDKDSKLSISNFKLTKSQLKSATKEGLHIYAISVYLDRDITGQGKTPIQFISELEELGRFIDSYLDVKNAPELEEILEDDLMFIFAFATPMEVAHAANILGLSTNQFSTINLVELEN
ncbi:MAG: hypothetical protein GY786_18420 [Proteobacteria bacterium]|nr:hypothetical protein [Pseudomonadota bacterium]